MPWNQVMDKWKSGALKSGGSGAPVKSQAQAVAIMLSEKKAAAGGKTEYAAKGKKMGQSRYSMDPGVTPVASTLGRKVIYKSPAKHPEQGDPQVQQPDGLDAILQKADRGETSGTYGGSRKDMMPAQAPSSTPQQGLMDYLRKLTR